MVMLSVKEHSPREIADVVQRMVLLCQRRCQGARLDGLKSRHRSWRTRRISQRKELEVIAVPRVLPTRPHTGRSDGWLVLDSRPCSGAG